jgi:hypothetical protein
MNIPKAKEFLNALITPISQGNKEDKDIANNRAYKKIIALFDEEAKGIELVGHTKWGMLNAVTEYVDHHNASRSNDARLDSAWFGTGDSMKARAIELLVA